MPTTVTLEDVRRVISAAENKAQEILQELSRHPIVETEKRLRGALQATGRDGREE